MAGSEDQKIQVKLECLKLAISIAGHQTRMSGDTLIEMAGDMADFVLGVEQHNFRYDNPEFFKRMDI